jgi:hypothetical protein
MIDQQHLAPPKLANRSMRFSCLEKSFYSSIRRGNHRVYNNARDMWRDITWQAWYHGR